MNANVSVHPSGAVRDRRSRPALHFLLLVSGVLSTWADAQESWDQPVEIVSEVRRYLTPAPIEGVAVTLRPFVGPLSSRARRFAAFDPPIDATLTDFGRAQLTLPRWSLAIDRPLAVVCFGTGDLVLPFRRETFKPRLLLRDTKEAVVTFVDTWQKPVSNSRVAALIGVHDSWHFPAMTWGPRYENLVVAMVGTTAADGSLVVPSEAVVALVERGGDAIPVILDDKASIVLPDSFDRAKADPRLATALHDDGREPPNDEAVAQELRGKGGDGSVEGIVVFDGYDDAEIIAVRYGTPLDILASHRMRTERPRGPFTQTNPYATDRERSFRISHLPAGRYRVQVAAPHFSPMLSEAFTIHDGQRLVLKRPIQLQRGGIVVVKGTMGYATMATPLARASLRFDGPNGIIDGLGPGKVTVGSWNGGCCGGPSREVRVPVSGEVIVDLSDEGR